MGSGIVGGNMMSIEIIGAKIGETIQNFHNPGLSTLSVALIRAVRLRNAAVSDLAVERQNLSKTVADRTQALSTANQALQVSEERSRYLGGGGI